jgi:sugar (pentulose or hexulose) kinase
VTLLLGIDEGTSAVKAALYDADLRTVVEARREKPLAHPRPGWVEQDPDAVLEAVVGAVAEVLDQAPGPIGVGTGHGAAADADRDLAGQALTGDPRPLAGRRPRR